MEVAGGIPPGEIDISVNPDMLHTATSVTTEVSDQEWIEIDTPDPVESGMETTGGTPPAVCDISVDTDVLNDLIFRRTSFPLGDSGVVVYSYSPSNIHSAEDSALVDKTL